MLVDASPSCARLGQYHLTLARLGRAAAAVAATATATATATALTWQLRTTTTTTTTTTIATELSTIRGCPKLICCRTGSVFGGDGGVRDLVEIGDSL